MDIFTEDSKTRISPKDAITGTFIEKTNLEVKKLLHEYQLGKLSLYPRKFERDIREMVSTILHAKRYSQILAHYPDPEFQTQLQAALEEQSLEFPEAAHFMEAFPSASRKAIHIHSEDNDEFTKAYWHAEDNSHWNWSQYENDSFLKKSLDTKTLLNELDEYISEEPADKDLYIEDRCKILQLLENNSQQQLEE